MSRRTVLVLVALGAAIAGFTFSTAARRGEADTATGSRSVAAGPQKVTLGWRESHGPAGEELVFSVETLEVSRRGWQAKLSVENRSSDSYEVISTLDRPFGLMVLSTGDYDELIEQDEGDTLPAVRPATRYEPRLPKILEPGDSWVGTISAPGALVANSWIRVVFGALVSVVEPSDGFTWISDRAYRLDP